MDSHYVFASTEGGGLLRKANEFASKCGSGNSINTCSKPFKLNISGDRARWAVKSSDYGFSYIPNYKTAISDKITSWKGEQFPLN